MKGRRFDLTYTHSAAGNHTVLLIRNDRYLKGRIFLYRFRLTLVILYNVLRNSVSAIAYGPAEAAGNFVGLFVTAK